MANNARQSAAAHDDEDYSYDLSNAIYGHFPISPHRSRATSPNSSKKRNPITTSANQNLARKTTISLNRHNAPPTWLPQAQQSGKREYNMSIHQSTWLNLNMAASGQSSESDLWILPELDDWEEGEETETESSSQGTLSPSASQSSTTAPQPSAAPQGPNKWAGSFFRRAANSNLERLRTRLEGDGWDFVGGRYRDDEMKCLGGGSGAEGEESLDEEFDVVVLSGERGV